MEEDGGAAEAIEQKRLAMLERLSNRHQCRITSSPSPNSSTTFESTQSFLCNFSQSKLSIESHFTHIRSQPKPNQKPELDLISNQISVLEKFVAENSYFLPSYEVRTCLNALDLLKKSLDEVSMLVIPKKKFSFKSKLNKKPVVSVQNDVVVVEADKKLDVKMGFGFRDRDGEMLVKEFSRRESDCQNGEFTVSGLRDCEVRLKGCLRALFVDNLVNCKIYVGAIMGSVLIEGAERCVFVLGSHQIRIHNVKDCDFYLRVRSRPIIEDCSGVRFAPYCLSYDGIERDLEEANLGEEMGNWGNVDDFRWLRAVQSPNWSVLPENERIAVADI